MKKNLTPVYIVGTPRIGTGEALIFKAMRFLYYLIRSAKDLPECIYSKYAGIPLNQ